jgi:hypothetical protein
MGRVRLEGAIKKGKIKRYSVAVKEEGGVNERGEGGRRGGRERLKRMATTGKCSAKGREC